MWVLLHKGHSVVQLTSGHLASLVSHFSPARAAGALQGQLGVQEQLPIQLVKIQCSADTIDGAVTFTSVDEIVSGFIMRGEMTCGTMKWVHQACTQLFNLFD